MKSFHLFILMLYTLGQLGFSVSKHYCMGMVKEVSLFKYSNINCCCPRSWHQSEEQPTRKCCHQEQEYIHVGAEQLSSGLEINLSASDFLIFDTGIIVFSDGLANTSNAIHPPWDSSQHKWRRLPLYLLFHELKLPQA